MKIINEASQLELMELHKITRLTFEENGVEKSVLNDPVIEEHHMNVSINGQTAFKMVCTPQDLDYLILGFLFSEGYIKQVEDVEYIYICREGERAKVQLHENVKFKPLQLKKTSDATACGNNRILVELEQKEQLQKLKRFEYSIESVLELSKICNQQAELFKETGGTHSCALMTEDKEIFFCEDIGRHNAIDKTIGKVLVSGKKLSQSILFTSGRIPSDMAEKAIRSKIPIIASHSAPTGEAIRLAKAFDLTLIGFVRGKRLNCYTD